MIPGLPHLLSGLRIQCCRELWRRLQTQLRSHRLAAVALIPFLAWELPYALGGAIKKKKKKKKEKERKKEKKLTVKS